jgi:threonine dehydrogenase-like Zn-dependent dehydrogenase
MRALCWHGKGDVRVDTVPDPKIQHSRDAVIKITACAICGSDLHLLDLEDAPAMYKKFRDKQDGVIKVVLRPSR